MKNRLFDKVIGHEDNRKKLAHLVRAKRLAPLNLFVGPSGVGKRQVALALAQVLVCETSDRACGECGPCMRIASGQSESLLQIAPDGAQVKADQAREVLDFCSLRSPGRSRIIIIDQAEKLNPQAGNSMLKLFEEAPANTYFFLMAPSPQSVLSTIRSRAQIFRFGTLSADDLQKNTSVDSWILESSGGRLDRIEQLQGEDMTERRQWALKVLIHARRGESAEVRELLKQDSPKREDALWLTKFWREFIRDAWLGQKNLGPLMHADLAEEIGPAFQASDSEFSQMAVKVQSLEQSLQSNFDVQLNLEVFLSEVSSAGVMPQ